ncbi:MAG: sulfotransferase, partial [Bacteroidales bacterium]|nr:sulfotransferase [Bacteroidales bacterium]
MKKRKKKGKEKFGILLPPAVGYSFSLLLNLLKKNKILPRYYLRVLAIVVINVINMPFRAYERKFINPRIAKSKINEDPIFIIGHWRSGTTLLHNLLTRDEQMGYVTTYQSVFPDTLFNIAGKFIFKNFTKLLIPATRKGDNVKLNPDLPQEEEFALGCAHPTSFYYFWLFPENIEDYYSKYILFKDVSDDTLINWGNDYSLTIKKALRNLNKRHFISKNPPNSGRIKQLLKLFPDAKFIHIHRNPVEVFLSTRHFFRIMLPHLQLHSINEKQLEESIFIIYKEMMNQLIQDKHLIPENNFIE